MLYRDRYTCQVCRRRLRVRHLEVDHIVEIARGGPSLDYLNLQTVCRSCHREKTRRFLRERHTRGGARAESVAPSVATEWAAEWFPA